MMPEQPPGRASYVPEDLKALLQEHLERANWDLEGAQRLWIERVRGEPGFAKRVADIAKRTDMNQLMADTTDDWNQLIYEHNKRKRKPGSG